MSDNSTPTSTHPSATKGIVYLVGAGPGAPDLLTLRGAQCLRKAECVIYDYLVNPSILGHAPPAAERICLGQHGRSRIWPPSEVNQLVISKARQGLTVVRLKGGDPIVFGHGAEELQALVEANIPFEVVPGISAGLAAGAYAGIPLTHRETSSAVALVTGQEDHDKTSSSLDYAMLGRFPGTLVFYMGVTTAEQWSLRLIEGGLDPQTPVAIIRRCSHPDQTIIECRLDEVAQRVEGPPKLRPPAIFVVGKVVSLAGHLNWFSHRLLFGQTILVARPAAQSQELIEPLERLGARVLNQPAITIGPPADWQPVDDAIRELPSYAWIVFSSSNGVDWFMNRLRDRGFDARQLGRSSIAAIGPGTAAALESYGLRADCVPNEYRAEALAEALQDQVAGKQVLLVRASRGRELLGDTLAQAGALVRSVVAYSSIDVEAADEEIAALMRSGKVDWTVVTSSSIAQALARFFGESLLKTRIVSISPVTSATLAELGFPATVESQVHTMQGIVDAIQRDAVKAEP